MIEPTKEDIKIAEGLSKLYLEVSAEQLDLTRRIASAIASEREKAAKELKALYDLIFIIKSTGDPKHPVKGEINYDAKEEFEQALETAIRAEDKE